MNVPMCGHSIPCPACEELNRRCYCTGPPHIRAMIGAAIRDAEAYEGPRPAGDS